MIRLPRTLSVVSLPLLVAGMCGLVTAPRGTAAQEPRAVLVTGATSGIGLRITEVLSENGFFVYAGARRPDDVARLDAMPNVRAVRLDVTVQEDLDDAVAFVVSQGRGLYGLVNNAGVATMAPLIEMRDEDMRFQMEVNLFGPFRVTKAFSDLLIESGGRILNVSSIAGILPAPFSGAYSMSKHGVEAYTDALAVELERFGVDVAAVEPGNYRSRIVLSMVERMRATGYSAEGSRYGSMLEMVSAGPLDRSQYEDPDDVALAALDFLTSEQPRRRYMVVPNRAEADMTIRRMLQEMVELNQEQRFAFGRDELVRMLDQTLDGAGPSAGAGARAEAGTSTTALGLHEAAVVGDVEAVRAHVQAGADLNARDPSGATPLLIAATFGRAEVARALIEAGAELDTPNREGSTPLLTAALLCRTEIVQALLDAGADPTISNAAGSTALDAVTGPFESVRPVYDYLRTTLGPYGFEIDDEVLRRTRPIVAEMLRGAGGEGR